MRVLRRIPPQAPAPPGAQGPSPQGGTVLHIAFVDARGRHHSGTAWIIATHPHAVTLRCAPDAREARRIRPGGDVALTFEVGQETFCGVGRVLEVWARGGTADLQVARPVRWTLTTRRRAYRVAVRVQADTAFGRAEVRNLSAAGGLLALTGAAALTPTVGTALPMVLQLPSSPSPVRLSGRVRRIVRSGTGQILLGVSFDEILARDQEAIAHYVTDRQRDLLCRRRDVRR